MTNRELCDFIDTSIQTLYNWKQNKPNLYKIVMDFKENISKNNNNFKNEQDELLNLIQQLSEDEKEYYKAVIKADILKKRLGK